MPFYLCNAIRKKCTTYRNEVKSLEFRRLSPLLASESAARQAVYIATCYLYRQKQRTETLKGIKFPTEQFTLERNALQSIMTKSRRWSSCHFCVIFAIRSLSNSKKAQRDSNAFSKGALRFTWNYCSKQLWLKAKKNSYEVEDVELQAPQWYKHLPRHVLVNP